MECQYKEVEKVEKGILKFPSTPFLRQLLIASAVWASYFQLGLSVGAPTVFIPQLRRNGSVVISEEMASWLSSANYYASVPWSLIVPALAHFIGPRLTFVLVVITSLAGFVQFYCSTTLTQLLISEMMQGPLVACQTTVSLMILTEYISPKHRGFFLTFKAATCFWGIWASNAIGTYFHWKNIGIFGMVCASYSVISVIVWPESPYWLASKGRLVSSRAAHRWLKGEDSSEEAELMSFIESQTPEVSLSHGKGTLTVVASVLKATISKGFREPVLLCLLLMTMYQCSGKLVISVYAVDIIKKITDSDSAAYAGMLILDGVTVLGMYAGSGLSRFLRRRTLLFTAEFTGIIMLFIISIYLYLVKLEILNENAFVSIILLMFFSTSISCGPIILATSIFGELSPLKYRSLAMSIVTIVANVMFGTTLKVAPLFFRTFGLHGGFFAYGLSSLVCAIVLFKYLPETKNKTLKQIQQYFEGE